ncbi:hypothetical protein RND81_10G048700 [Saponaria officinalis]|uniref:Reverse transcriptase zinc-binding domain-containing protein n=1 Tax=Saponaria officinalis TaxID=3572 RepID=A0AAW1HY92_SAPOF
MACISTPYYSVGINGGQFGYFQGDVNSVQAIVGCLRRFSDISGLEPSLEETNIFFGGVPAGVQVRLMALTGFSKSTLPIRYLGVPLAGGRMTVKMFDSLMDKLFKSVHHWSSLFISHSGKIQLINSVFLGTLIYWCSVFLLPKEVVHRVNKLCSSFYWGDTDSGRHIHWLRWDCFTKPRDARGVGIEEILSWNRAIFLKWFLRLICSGSCWSIWARCYLLKGGDPWGARHRAGDPRGWKDLLCLRDHLIDSAGSVAGAKRLLEDWSIGGAFRTQKAYQFFSGWVAAPRKMKCLWESMAVPKHRLVCWTSYSKKLTTVDMLQRRGLSLANK